MNFKQLQTLNTIIPEHLPDAEKWRSYQNPGVVEEPSVLDNITPFRFSAMPGQVIVVVLDNEGTVVRSWKEPRR